MWSQTRHHATSLQQALSIELVDSLDACAFAGAATNSGGLAMLADVPRLLRHCKAQPFCSHLLCITDFARRMLPGKPAAADYVVMARKTGDRF